MRSIQRKSKRDYSGENNGDTMQITVTDLRNNLGKYLGLSKKEDIYITKHGKVISKLSNPFKSKVNVAKSFFNSMPDTMALEEAKEKRLN